jgi:hypothetical protein
MSTIFLPGYRAGNLAAMGAAVFSPLSLSPVLWVKSDAGTLQTVGGSAASADGDPVGQWLDQSGNGNHLSQATSSKRGTLKLALLNGLPIVRFDGVDDILATAAVVTTSLSFSMFLVLKAPAASSKMFLNGSANGYGLTSNSGSRNVLYENVTNISDGALTSNYEVWEAIRTTTLSMWVNGVSKLSGSGGTPAAPTTGTSLGDALSLSQPSACDIFEALLFDSALSTANRQLLETYFSGRTAIF